MTTDFEIPLIDAAFELVAEHGWRRLSLVRAADRVAVPMEVARALLPDRFALLRRLNALVDRAALAQPIAEPSVRGRLFDLLMARFDEMQPRRAGILAAARALPFDPPAALLLGALSARSMGWMLQRAGAGFSAPHRAGLLAVWGMGMRAWRQDSSPDLASTMAALDKALERADNTAKRFGARDAPDLDSRREDEAPVSSMQAIGAENGNPPASGFPAAGNTNPAGE